VRTTATWAFLILTWTVEVLADTLNSAGRHADAVEMFSTALEERRRVRGEEHSLTLGLMNNLASALKSAGQHAGLSSGGGGHDDGASGSSSESVSDVRSASSSPSSSYSCSSGRRSSAQFSGTVLRPPLPCHDSMPYMLNTYVLSAGARPLSRVSRPRASVRLQTAGHRQISGVQPVSINVGRDAERVALYLWLVLAEIDPGRQTRPDHGRGAGAGRRNIVLRFDAPVKELCDADVERAATQVVCLREAAMPRRVYDYRDWAGDLAIMKDLAFRGHTRT
jgi:hypothetical protein